jgi:hypothetical protein
MAFSRRTFSAVAAMPRLDVNEAAAPARRAASAGREGQLCGTTESSVWLSKERVKNWS